MFCLVLSRLVASRFLSSRVLRMSIPHIKTLAKMLPVSFRLFLTSPNIIEPPRLDENEYHLEVRSPGQAKPSEAKLGQARPSHDT